MHTPVNFKVLVYICVSPIVNTQNNHIAITFALVSILLLSLSGFLSTLSLIILHLRLNFTLMRLEQIILNFKNSLLQNISYLSVMTRANPEQVNP